MVFETLVNALAITVPTAVAISGVAILADSDKSWDWRKFLYTIGLATFAGVGIIQTQFAGAVTEANVLAIIGAIAGGTYFGNKAIGTATRLKNND